jgi:hypothetical protein
MGSERPLYISPVANPGAKLLTGKHALKTQPGVMLKQKHPAAFVTWLFS